MCGGVGGCDNGLRGCLAPLPISHFSKIFPEKKKKKKPLKTEQKKKTKVLLKTIDPVLEQIRVPFPLNCGYLGKLDHFTAGMKNGQKISGSIYRVKWNSPFRVCKKPRVKFLQKG